MTPKISKRPHLYRFILFLIPLLIVAIYGTTLLVTQNPLTAYRVSTPLCKTRSLDDPSVAQKPRCSEHEAGLALDVYVEGFAGMGFMKSKAGRFVNAHCQEYGFIIRYPLFKKHKTGIAYEPWHVRYVGKPHAAIISRFNITLEEYIKFLLPDTFYIIDGYCISRQSPKEGKLKLPANCNDICVSPDNTGYYIVTGKVGAP